MSDTVVMIIIDLPCRNMPIDNNPQTNQLLYRRIYILKLEPARLRGMRSESGVSEIVIPSLAARTDWSLIHKQIFFCDS